MADGNRDLAMGGEHQSEESRAKSTRGFASMDSSKQREIARKGGIAAHMKGTAHEFTPEEARMAGKKGGETVSRDRAHMAAIGREGGQARSLRAMQRRESERSLGSGNSFPSGSDRSPFSAGGSDEGGRGPTLGSADKDYNQNGAM